MAPHVKRCTPGLVMRAGDAGTPVGVGIHGERRAGHVEAGSLCTRLSQEVSGVELQTACHQVGSGLGQAFAQHLHHGTTLRRLSSAEFKSCMRVRSRVFAFIRRTLERSARAGVILLPSAQSAASLWTSGRTSLNRRLNIVASNLQETQNKLYLAVCTLLLFTHPCLDHPSASTCASVCALQQSGSGSGAGPQQAPLGRIKGLSDGAKRVCLHHVSPGGHHIHTPCTDACAEEALCSALTPLSPLCLLLLLLSPALTRGGIRVAPQRQDWVGYIPALMPGPYGWHVIGKSHHMRVGLAQVPVGGMVPKVEVLLTKAATLQSWQRTKAFLKFTSGQGWMEPLLPADTELMEPEADKDARRKIQFSVPSSVPTQLDPRQVEMIRRRRPTPATLFRLTDPPSPEEDIDPWVLGENGALKAKLVHTTTYQPPSLKAVQRMALAHLASLDMTSVDKEDSSSGEEEEEREKKSQQSPSATDPREKSQSLRDQCAQLDSLTETADLSLHRSDEEEEKGE
ncbi:hypothetical protein F7725_014354 [Dissostichus mawsoni]|uniref:Protein phosphatase 1 regulatory subunit 1B n=1 Tax=Dissostichus mawsoni TaxID=36200 RepID=A0A7J5YW60_DISMA|nr:hypothetical protein F7725_014354 [Dissostichus mawsoni]